MEVSGQLHAMAALPPGKEPHRYRFYRRLCGAQSQLGRCNEVVVVVVVVVVGVAAAAAAAAAAAVVVVVAAAVVVVRAASIVVVVAAAVVAAGNVTAQRKIKFSRNFSSTPNIKLSEKD
jgi:hypothetical protein